MPSTIYEGEPTHYPGFERAQQKVNDPVESRIYRPFESWSDDHAAKVVRADFSTASNYREQNHDYRWVKADALYAGYKKVKYWNGTNVPKANIPIYVTLASVESILPRAISALFGDWPWFEAKPGIGTSPAAARHVRDIILSQLEWSDPREQLRRVAKSGVLYGDGIMMCGWYHREGRELQYIPEFIPKVQPLFDPLNNRFIQVPTGEYHRIIREQVIDRIINRPFWRYVSIKNIFIDPDTPGPSISGNPEVGEEGARYLIHRSHISIDALDSLRNEPGFEGIPDRPYLLLLSRMRSVDHSDTTLSEGEAMRGVSYFPYTELSIDPAAQKLEVLHYFTSTRQVWLLNRALTIYNRPSQLGRICYYHIPWADMVDRFYGTGIADVSEGEQRVQEGLISARLNELALSIDPMTVRSRHGSTSIYEVRVRPGGLASTGASDARHDVIRQFPPGATNNAHLEVQASELRHQRVSGVSDVAMLGVGTPSNPAARTAAGSGIQAQGAFSRVMYFVENIESQIMEPALHDVHDLDRKYLDPNQLVEGLGSQRGEQIQQAGIQQGAQGAQGEIQGIPPLEPGLDPILIWGADVHFYMRSGSRMAARTSILQVLPLILQSLLNPALLQQLASTGKTINLIEVMQMVMDATGYREKVEWITNLSPQQMQMLSKPSPEEIKAQMQDRRFEKMHDMLVDKEELGMLKSIFEQIMRNSTEAQMQKLKIGAESMIPTLGTGPDVGAR